MRHLLLLSTCSEMSKIVHARITFVPESAGGRIAPALSGIKPQLKLGDVRTSAVVRAEDESQVFEPGRPYVVTIEVLFWEQYGSKFKLDDPVELFDGSRLIAKGEYLPHE